MKRFHSTGIIGACRLLLLVITLTVLGCNADVRVKDGDSTDVANGDTAAVDTVHDTVVIRTPDDSENGNGENGNGEDGEPSMSSRNIRVELPRPNTNIGSPQFLLKGEARTFENTVTYRIVDKAGRKLAENHFMAQGEMGQFGPFSVMIDAPSGYSGPATLKVFQYSAKDGSEIDAVNIPLRFTASASKGPTSLTIYLTNYQANPGIDCQKVFAVTRTVSRTPAVAEAAINELLRGPTGAETEKGYGTEIPSGVVLRDITIDNGVARVDFNDRLNSGSGSCSVGAARAQIEQTLKQFPSVKSVVISVNGNTGDVLQP